MPSRNEVFFSLPKLDIWRASRAEVDFIGDKRVRLPRIWAPAICDRPSERPTILAISGMHMEETSGPLFLLEPTNFDCLRHCFNFLAYPIVNQYGLSYPRNADEHLLRCNRMGLNYNSGWGRSKKADEVAIVEKDVVSHLRFLDIIFAVALHEDSELPNKGYIYTNGINQKSKTELQQIIEGSQTSGCLRRRGDKQYNGNGVLQNGWVIDNEIDADGGVEAWLETEMGIPIITIEAPFGHSSKSRLLFHKTIFDALVKILAAESS